MARADLPAFDIRPVGNHAVVPKQKDRVRLSVEHIFLEIPYQRPLFRRVGLAQHLVVEVDLLGVLKVSVVCGVDRARQVPLHVEHRVDDALAIAGQDGVELNPPSANSAAASPFLAALPTPRLFAMLPILSTRLADCVAAWPRAPAVRCASSLSRRAQAAAAPKIPQVAVMCQPRR